MQVDPVCARLLIRGRVQGVWYRASAKRAAEERGLAGWVRNLQDGSVEALAQGPRDAVEAFVTWCRRGPPAARVDEVEVEWREPEAGLAVFGVRR